MAGSEALGGRGPLPQARPLAGRRVYVTRPGGQADSLVGRLEVLGAEVVVCPTIQILPPEDFTPLDQAIAHLSGYDWIIFTSVNGVRYFFDRLPAAAAGQLGRARLAAIGPATAQALAERRARVDLMPDHYVAEAILERIGDVAGQRILLPRADIARQALADGLRSKGAEVDEVTAYRTAVAASGLDTLVPARSGDIFTFTSPSTVRNFLALLGERPAGAVIGGALVACIGPITAAAARASGLRVDVEAGEHTMDGLVAAILEHLGPGGAAQGGQ